MNEADQAIDAAEYLRMVLEPLARPADRSSILITHEIKERAVDGAMVPVCIFNVAVPEESVGYLAGKGGATADAARVLLRAWAGTAGWRKRLDIWIASQ